MFVAWTVACCGVAWASPHVMVEATTATNTPAGIYGWTIFDDGRMVYHQQNSRMRPDQRPAARRLSAAQMATLKATIERARFFELQTSIGNGGRGEPTDSSLLVTIGSTTHRVDMFDNGDGSPATRRFKLVWDMVQTLSRR